MAFDAVTRARLSALLPAIIGGTAQDLAVVAKGLSPELLGKLEQTLAVAAAAFERAGDRGFAQQLREALTTLRATAPALVVSPPVTPTPAVSPPVAPALVVSPPVAPAPAATPEPLVIPSVAPGSDAAPEPARGTAQPDVEPRAELPPAAPVVSGEVVDSHETIELYAIPINQLTFVLVEEESQSPYGVPPSAANIPPSERSQEAEDYEIPIKTLPQGQGLGQLFGLFEVVSPPAADAHTGDFGGRQGRVSGARIRPPRPRGRPRRQVVPEPQAFERSQQAASGIGAISLSMAGGPEPATEQARSASSPFAGQGAKGIQQALGSSAFGLERSTEVSNSAVAPGGTATVNNIYEAPLPEMWLPPTLGHYEERRGYRAHLTAAVGELLLRERRVALFGIPGVGKSYQAREVARHLQEHFRAGGVLLVEGVSEILRQPARRQALWNEWASHRFGGAQPKDQRNFAPSAVRSALSNHGPLLVIFDGLDDEDSESLKPLTEALPEHDTHLLLVCPNHKVARSLSEIVYEVPELTLAEAREQARARLEPRMPAGDEPAWLDELLEAVGGHPMTLSMALETLDARDPEEWEAVALAYASDIRSGSSSGPLLFPEPAIGDPAMASVVRAYLLLDEDAQARFRSLGMLPPGLGFDLHAAAQVWQCDEHSARQSLNRLLDASLVTRSTGTGESRLWRQNSVLRNCAINLLVREDEREALCRHYVDSTTSWVSDPALSDEALIGRLPQLAHAVKEGSQIDLPRTLNLIAACGTRFAALGVGVQTVDWALQALTLACQAEDSAALHSAASLVATNLQAALTLHLVDQIYRPTEALATIEGLLAQPERLTRLDAAASIAGLRAIAMVQSAAAPSADKALLVEASELIEGVLPQLAPDAALYAALCYVQVLARWKYFGAAPDPESQLDLVLEACERALACHAAGTPDWAILTTLKALALTNRTAEPDNVEHALRLAREAPRLLLPGAPRHIYGLTEMNRALVVLRCMPHTSASAIDEFAECAEATGQVVEAVVKERAPVLYVLATLINCMARLGGIELQRTPRAEWWDELMAELAAIEGPASEFSGAENRCLLEWLYLAATVLAYSVDEADEYAVLDQALARADRSLNDLAPIAPYPLYSSLLSERIKLGVSLDLAAPPELRAARLKASAEAHAGLLEQIENFHGADLRAPLLDELRVAVARCYFNLSDLPGEPGKFWLEEALQAAEQAYNLLSNNPALEALGSVLGVLGGAPLRLMVYNVDQAMDLMVASLRPTALLLRLHEEHGGSNVEQLRQTLYALRIGLGDSFALHWAEQELGELPEWIEERPEVAEVMAFSYNCFAYMNAAQRAKQTGSPQDWQKVAETGEAMITFDLPAIETHTNGKVTVAGVYDDVSTAYVQLAIAHADRNNLVDMRASFRRAAELCPPDKVPLAFGYVQYMHALSVGTLADMRVATPNPLNAELDSPAELIEEGLAAIDTALAILDEGFSWARAVCLNRRVLLLAQQAALAGANSEQRMALLHAGAEAVLEQARHGADPRLLAAACVTNADVQIGLADLPGEDFQRRLLLALERCEEGLATLGDSWCDERVELLARLVRVRCEQVMLPGAAIRELLSAALGAAWTALEHARPDHAEVQTLQRQLFALRLEWDVLFFELWEGLKLGPCPAWLESVRGDHFFECSDRAFERFYTLRRRLEAGSTTNIVAWHRAAVAGTILLSPAFSEDYTAEYEKLRPELSATYAGLAEAYATQGRLSDAQDAYRQALRIDSELETARLGLVQALVRLGQIGEARDTIDAAPPQLRAPLLELLEEQQLDTTPALGEPARALTAGDPARDTLAAAIVRLAVRAVRVGLALDDAEQPPAATSLATLRAALEQATRPEARARAAVALADALRLTAMAGEDEATPPLAEARALYDEARAFFRKAERAEEFLGTQYGYALTLARLASGDPALLEQALNASADARPGLAARGTPALLARLDRERAVLRLQLGLSRSSPPAGLLQQTLRAFVAADASLPAAGPAGLRAMLALQVALVAQLLAAVSLQPAALLRQALGAAERGLALLPADAGPVVRGYAAMARAEATLGLAILGERVEEGDLRGTLGQAIDDASAAIEALAEHEPDAQAAAHCARAMARLMLADAGSPLPELREAALDDARAALEAAPLSRSPWRHAQAQVLRAAAQLALDEHQLAAEEALSAVQIAVRVLHPAVTPFAYVQAQILRGSLVARLADARQNPARWLHTALDALTESVRQLQAAPPTVLGVGLQLARVELLQTLAALPGEPAADWGAQILAAAREAAELTRAMPAARRLPVVQVFVDAALARPEHAVLGEALAAAVAALAAADDEGNASQIIEGRQLIHSVRDAIGPAFPELWTRIMGTALPDWLGAEPFNPLREEGLVIAAQARAELASGDARAALLLFDQALAMLPAGTADAARVQLQRAQILLALAALPGEPMRERQLAALAAAWPAYNYATAAEDAALHDEAYALLIAVGRAIGEDLEFIWPGVVAEPMPPWLASWQVEP